MKTTLTKIKAALQGAATISYVRGDCIHITPDADYVPGSIRMPCIGIKDGPIQHDLEYGGDVRRMEVQIAVFKEVHKEEAAIIGDTTGQVGLLDIADDVKSVLNHNLLDGTLSEMQLTRESAIRIFVSDTGLAVQKILTFAAVKM